MPDKVSTVQEIFDNIDKGFEPEKSAGVDAVFQFNLTGDNGGQYWIKVADRQAEVSEGEHGDPTMIITSAADDYIAMVNGELNPMTAFMKGKIKVKGDMGLALKLQTMFGLV